MPAKRGSDENEKSNKGGVSDKKGDNIDTYCHTIHDKFNLLVLPIVSFLAVAYFINVDYYYLLFYVFLCYMLLDSLWLAIYPRTVASPGVIITHHIMVILVWLCGYYASDMRGYTCTGRFAH